MKLCRVNTLWSSVCGGNTRTEIPAHWMYPSHVGTRAADAHGPLQTSPTGQGNRATELQWHWLWSMLTGDVLSVPYVCVGTFLLTYLPCSWKNSHGLPWDMGFSLHGLGPSNWAPRPFQDPSGVNPVVGTLWVLVQEGTYSDSKS